MFYKTLINLRLDFLTNQAFHFKAPAIRSSLMLIFIGIHLLVLYCLLKHKVCLDVLPNSAFCGHILQLSAPSGAEKVLIDNELLTNMSVHNVQVAICDGRGHCEFTQSLPVRDVLWSNFSTTFLKLLQNPHSYSVPQMFTCDLYLQSS